MIYSQQIYKNIDLDILCPQAIKYKYKNIKGIYVKLLKHVRKATCLDDVI